MDNDTIKMWLGDDSLSPLTRINEKLKGSGIFADNEIGLYHPMTNAILKFRNNGMIDMFTNKNGFRIDPVTNSVNVFCNNEKHHIGNYDAWSSNHYNINTKEYKINCSDEEINIGTLNIKRLNDEKNSIIEEMKELKQIIIDLENRIVNGGL